MYKSIDYRHSNRDTDKIERKFNKKMSKIVKKCIKNKNKHTISFEELESCR